MKLNTITIEVGDLDAAHRFFIEVLELGVTRNDSGLLVTVGVSVLQVRPSTRAAPHGVHHLAFDIPPESFTWHRDWLRQRVPLLTSADGVTEFEGPPTWNSRSVYFSGPDQMVLELIARRNRSGPVAATLPDLLSISEVGVAVTDVPGTVRRLQQTYKIVPFGVTSDEFAAVGDEDGLLIVVADGRGWLPTFEVVATPLTTRIELAADPTVPVLDLNPLTTVVATRPGAPSPSA